MTAILWGNVLVVISAVLATASVLLYGLHPRTRGTWWHDSVGRHLMSYMLAIALVLDLVALRAVVGASLETEWFLRLRIAAFTLVPLVLGQRLAIIVHVLFGKDEHDNSDAYTRTDGVAPDQPGQVR